MILSAAEYQKLLKKGKTKSHKSPIQIAREKMISDRFIAAVSKLNAECVPEYQFHPTRKWRIDYALPKEKIAIEVEGGVYTEGRHIRPQGFLGDMEKYNTMTLMGWRLFRTTPDKLFSKEFLDLIKQAINVKNYGK